MKKALFISAIMLLITSVQAQKVTVNANYYKMKLGVRTQLYKAMAEHNAKYRPAGSPYAVKIYNLTGGPHHGELLILSNSGISFKERDGLKPQPDDLYNDWAKNVSPFLESMTGGDIMVYRKEYSSTAGAYAAAADKAMSTCYALNSSKLNSEFWDIVKKLPKVFDRVGRNTVAYVPVTGVERLCFTWRFPNGWAELDNDTSLQKAYDEVYGAGTYEKDIKIFRSYIESRTSTLMTLNKEISSK